MKKNKLVYNPEHIKKLEANNHSSTQKVSGVEPTVAISNPNSIENNGSENQGSKLETNTNQLAETKKTKNEKPSKKVLVKKEKNVLYDMNACVNPLYLKTGEVTTVKIPASFLKPYKQFAIAKDVSLQDILSIALYQYGTKEAFLKNKPDIV